MIEIDDVDYKLDDLSDNAKAQFQGLQVADVELNRLDIQVTSFLTAPNAYLSVLQAALSSNSWVGV